MTVRVTAAPRAKSEARMPVMGTTAHIVLVDPPRDLVIDMQRFLRTLEARWSRFQPDSEISRLNRTSARPTHVDSSTRRLIEAMVSAWTRTEGRFQPTLGAALSSLGYKSTSEWPTPVPLATGDRHHDLSEIEIDPMLDVVTLPAGMSLDPGGIGKGLAADLACERAMQAGASGALVNIGGDLRVRGAAPDGPCWAVEVRETAFRTRALTTLYINDAAVATSTPLKRCWRAGEQSHHHLLDASTGRPANAPAVVTVVARDGWWAEAAATAMACDPSFRPPAAATFVAQADGREQRCETFADFEWWGL